MNMINIQLDFPEIGEDQTATGITEGVITFAIDGKQFWPPESCKAPGYEWTWVDMLDFLADVWPLMYCDADIPTILGNLRPELLIDELVRFDPMLDSYLPEDIKDIQEFIFSHDLARAFPGSRVPSLLFIPEGKYVWVGGRALKRKMRMDEFIQTMEEFAERIASRLKHATDDHAEAVLSAWQDRDKVDSDEFRSLASGADQEVLDELGDRSMREQILPVPSGSPRLSEPVAVFRLTHRLLPIAWVRDLLVQVSRIPRVDTPVLDDLMPLATEYMTSSIPPHLIPAEQGYELAQWLRRKLQIEPDNAVDPKLLLCQWDVIVKSISIPDDGLEAVAVWGPDHGPAVLVNEQGRYSREDAGRCASYAHELLHLLIDRDGALPLADVDHASHKSDTEKRAKAFAAEFLAPQSIVGKRFSEGLSPAQALKSLCEQFKASQELVAWQAFNSGVRLEPDSFSFLKRKVSEPESFTWEKMLRRSDAYQRRMSKSLY